MWKINQAFNSIDYFHYFLVILLTPSFLPSFLPYLICGSEWTPITRFTKTSIYTTTLSSLSRYDTWKLSLESFLLYLLFRGEGGNNALGLTFLLCGPREHFSPSAEREVNNGLVMVRKGGFIKVQRRGETGKKGSQAHFLNYWSTKLKPNFPISPWQKPT